MKLQRSKLAPLRRAKRASRKALDFERLLFTPEPGENTLADVKSGGDIETDAAAEVKILSDTFSGRAKLEQARFELATDSEFWFAVYFQNREQKEIFLKFMDWFETGDKYLNGLALAEELGIELPLVKLPKPKRVSRRLKKLVRKS